MKQILTAMLSITFVTALLGAGTLAYFTDTETSSGNAFTAGNFDLKVNDYDPDVWDDGVSATWVFDDMKPGDSVYNHLGLSNLGSSIDADHVEITCDYSVTEETPRLESDTDHDTDLHPDTMAMQMVIVDAWYDDGYNINLLTGDNTFSGEHRDEWQIEDVAPFDEKITLYDLKYDVIDDLPPPSGSEDYTFRLRVKFDENAGNDFQGDIFDLTVYFTLNQHSSQT